MPKWILYTLLPLSFAGYILIGYFIERSNFLQLITVYSSLFLISYIIGKNHFRYNFNILLLSGLIFRFCLIFSIPVLSDDFYRFVWDGRVQQLGFNPFDYSPRQLLELNADPFLQQLFPYLNSPDYYSVYPQLCQTFFKLASLVGGLNLKLNLIVLKSMIFLAELGTVYLIHKLILLRKKSPSLTLIYLLNPLVIIELTGNIHFEAFMIFFFLLAAWLIQKKRSFSSAAALSLAIQAKLLPLMAIPLLIGELGFRKSAWYSIICLSMTALLSLGLLNTPERFLHFSESIRLYYGKFEFNGGLYLLLRSAGWWMLGYNPVAVLSKVMLLMALAGMIYIYFKKLNLLSGLFWILVIYLSFSAIVHPWYLTPLIAFSSFVRFRFVLAWSALIPLSYITYSSMPYRENYWVTEIEYLLVFGFLVWEFRTLYSGPQLKAKPSI